MIGLATMAVVVASGTAAAAIDIQPYGTCGGSFSPSVGGGEAHWDLLCDGGNITIKGWVKDTDADGKCARVTATFADGTNEQWSACPKDTKVSFSKTKPGSLIDAYLTVT